MTAYHARQHKDLAPEKTDKYLSLGFKIEQRMAREWLPHLKGSELKLAQFVLTNSLKRGKPSTHWHAKQAVDHGMGISERSFYSAMKSLKARGLLIAKTGYGAGWHFSLNPGWNHAGSIPNEAGSEGKIVPIRASKRIVAATKATEIEASVRGENNPEIDFAGTAKIAVEDCKNCSDPKKDRFPRQTKPSLTTFETAGEPLPAHQQAAEKPEKISSPGKKKSPPFPPAPPTALAASGDAFERSWKGAWKAAHALKMLPGTRAPAPWTPRDKASVKRVAQTWDETAYGSFHDFLAFCVQSWGQVIRSQFGWMTEKAPPSQPEIGFVTVGKFLPKFIEAFCDQETTRWIGTLAGSDKEIARHVSEGMSPEAAVLEVAKAQAIEADRKRRQADIDYAKRMVRMAELTLERSRREKTTRERYAQPRQRESFAPAAQAEERAPGAPIIAETADFSSWGLDRP